MARSVYVAGLGPGVGKGTVALGLVELLSRQVARIGVFRPLVSGDGDDPLLTLLTKRYPVVAPYAESYGVTMAEASALVADGRWEELISRIVERYREVERHAASVVVIGSDFVAAGGAKERDEIPRELGFNARLATEFGSVVVPVISGDGRGAESIAAAARSAYHSLVDLDATVVAVIANRVPEGVGPLPDAGLPVPLWSIPSVAAVAAPTVAEVAAALDATVVSGGEGALDRDVLDYVVGAAHVPVVLDHLTDGALMITPGDRADLLLAASAAHAAGNVTLSGLVLTLGEPADPRVVRVIERLNTGLAMLIVDADSYHTIAAASHIQARLGTSTPRKIEAALGAFEENVDTAELARVLDVARSSRVTPLMFENDLIDRARTERRHLVLPEGTDERILRASETLLRRGVADLTLLGDPTEINRRARELGVEIGAAQLIDPAHSPWRDDFAERYAELRKKRGVSLDLAYDVVRDVNYFGTMMVAEGLADGMVSGANHTTAATIRPAFEIIKTVPDVSVASSVFFMLLADRVLVYGDCAVNPDPDAAQLADIALSSARTAAAFGIEPRVAMLSYSTGSSGAGADVEKVAAATALVRERRPDLPVEGPIQYDAAVDPAVAATKLPGSAVAGQATVLIFPDLNTGNNTYKAVQRSANAVAVGPVMQGLRRPVNDLSRGATVKDIVNTAAITAIQAAAL
ncbi:phosphate acetyltransferase [Paractinoplanes brasiliensis]|uniref:Phosphate acetyltransferase n=1 Tax=Paractinoplanes brasiliensis TaxID=52695 RepID=A0A4R6JX07_9ACTN|nr:phosphate acetyltransferase [Actinoplanes brasiliensis]TDO40412.1 phosphate acetyltransferase [Actinoplanes brasiliensis]GID25479.1 phosphate acetyltransferase [Actinoplanes brasiliensis]